MWYINYLYIIVSQVNSIGIFELNAIHFPACTQSYNLISLASRIRKAEWSLYPQSGEVAKAKCKSVWDSLTGSDLWLQESSRELPWFILTCDL